MNRVLALVLVLCCLCPLFSAAEEALPVTLALAEVPAAGSDTLTLRLGGSVPEGLLVNAFAGEEAIGASAEVAADGLILLKLTRPLAEGETVRVAAELPREDGGVAAAALSFTVAGRFDGKLGRLRARVDGMWTVWDETWAPAFREGTVYLRLRLDSIPFVTFPDEAPEMRVEEADGKAFVYLSETLPADWTLSFASGMPVTLTPAVWDETAGAWTGEAGFDSVYLVSAQAEKRMSVTVVYQRSDAFLASWPIVEYVEKGDEVIAFNCYGYGTARSFGGGMYAIVGQTEAWYAEYGVDGTLTDYINLMTGCVYDPEGHLVEGEEDPEAVHAAIRIW
ncbi:MAG: hypothetical protein IJK28_02565 [Clostridia bacterium]|nr:hypothetical protein [Clostridia bacterium]